MSDLILHPTAATPVPVTHIAPGKSGKARKVKAQRDITVDDLRELCAARGIRFTTKHTKAELRRLYAGEAYFHAAAYVREKLARKMRKMAK